MARTTTDGNIVLLEDQGRSLWDRRLIEEGQSLVQQSLATRRFAAYTLQDATAAMHASSESPANTDCPQIVAI